MAGERTRSVIEPALFREGRARAATLLVAATFFMEMMDGTIIATALPQMARSFGTGPVMLNIGMTLYLVAVGAFIPLSGWLAERFGARIVLAGAIGLFSLASLLCASSDDLVAFGGARLLQGVAGAAMVPVGRLIVLRMVPPAGRVDAMALIVWPGLVAPVLGPVLGGLVVEHLSWRWIFLVNLPLGAAALVATLLIVPPFDTGRIRPFDTAGCLMSTAALAALVFGISALGDPGGHGAKAACLLIMVGLALGAGAIVHMRSRVRPFVDLRPLAIPSFAVMAYGGTLQRMAIGAMPLLLPLLFQVGLGYDAVTSGSLILCLFAGNLAMKIATSPILRRYGFRDVMLVNGLLAACTIAACSAFSRTTPLWAIGGVLAAGGAFRSMQFTSLTMVQFADMPAELLADANLVSSMVLQIGLGLGVVLGAALLNISSWLGGHLGGSPDIADFRFAFVVAALVAAGGLIDVALMSRTAGDAALGRRPA